MQISKNNSIRSTALIPYSIDHRYNMRALGDNLIDVNFPQDFFLRDRVFEQFDDDLCSVHDVETLVHSGCGAFSYETSDLIIIDQRILVISFGLREAPKDFAPISY